jgi:glycosyltransferase involved in cell wall biosynthesis
MMLERLSASWKDIIILNNTHDLDQAKELEITPRKEIALVHNGIDPFRLHFLPRDEARIRLTRVIPTAMGINLDQKKLIGTIANLYPTKGLQYLVESASHISDPNAAVCIIGEGEERPKLERLIAKLGLENKVFLLGRLPEASQYLLGFDAFVLPSVKEGFPWSVLEAMSAKLPVIATSVGAVPEIIEDGVSGYIVKPGDPTQLAERINTTIGNERAAQEMGIQAHQKVLFSFTLDSMIKQTEQLL